MPKGSKSVGDVAEAADDIVVATSHSTAGHTAADTAAHLKDEAAELASKAGGKLKDAAATGKDMAADAVHGLADAARDVAGRLDDGDPQGTSAKAAGYARKAAESMDRFSESLKGKDLDELADDARRAVRQHPAIAVGAAAVIGFALARFLKSGSGGDRNA